MGFRYLVCIIIHQRRDKSTFQCVFLHPKSLTVPMLRLYNSPIAAKKAAVGIETPHTITKRTSANTRYFYASFLWQCAWENRKVRRYLVSGSLNPMYAVALLSETNGDSHPFFTKETAMSAPATAPERAASLDFYRAIACAKALNEAIGILADHPCRQPSSDTLSVLHTLLDDFLDEITDGVEEITDDEGKSIWSSFFVAPDTEIAAGGAS